MSAPREIELKLEIAPASRRRWDVRKLVGDVVSGPGTTRSLVSRYFDTDDLALHRRGYVLRVRREGERRIQTLKADEGSLFDRPEWESDVDRDEPDLDRIADPDSRREIAALGPLRPVFETTVERTTWPVSRGLSDVEVALDEGRITGGAATEALGEIELELKTGSPADLFALALDLAANGQVRVGVRSKSERGYGLLAGRADGPVKAEKVSLSRSMSAGEAFQAVARSCLRHFRLNESRLVADRHPESLHQARVAIRRLRSAFTLFGPVIAGREADALKRDLRALSGSLGEARNLDVYRERTLRREQAGAPDEPGLADLAARVDRDREAAYDRVIRRLGSKRFRQTTVRLIAFVETGSWLLDEDRSKARERDVESFARKVLGKRARRVREGGRHMERLSPEVRHRVRIEAKKLRYAAEFFTDLPRGKTGRRRHKAYLASLEDLQQHLGELNDIVTGHDFARTLAEGGGKAAPALLFAAGHVSGEADGREAASLAAAAEAHATFRDAKPFWKG